MTEQAQADLVVGDDGPAARRIAFAAGQRFGNRIADDDVGNYLRAIRDAASGSTAVNAASASALSENLSRIGAKPGIGEFGFLGAKRRRRVERTDTAGAFNFRVPAVDRSITRR